VRCGSGFSEGWQGVQGAKNGLWREAPARGLTRPWRTLAWLFLIGLRPRRARLRFTKHGHCRKEEVGGEPSKRGNQLTEDIEDEESGAVASALLKPRRGPRGRLVSPSWSMDSASLPSVLLIGTAGVPRGGRKEYSVSVPRGA